MLTPHRKRYVEYSTLLVNLLESQNLDVSSVCYVFEPPAQGQISLGVRPKDDTPASRFRLTPQCVRNVLGKL